MNVTLALAQFYTNIHPEQQDVHELAAQIGAQIGEVETITDLGTRYQGVLIAKVVACRKHENSDHLNVCKIDDGGKANNVERDEHGLVQVVCGAPNVREGLTVAWLPPGSTVPESVGKDPFVLEARPLRGEVSYGMLASPRELAIGDNHEGILEVDDEHAQPGMLFADVYHLNDHIIDIENKMFTHRPDCFGVLGVYREIAGVQHQQFKGPEWYNPGGKYSLDREADVLPLTVTNDLPELVPRFAAITMRDVTVKPSPVWLQVHLMRAGIRPINNIVDITNYVMYLTGQPLHAYDYDKLKAQDEGAAQAAITVRHPRSGEKILLLNGKEIEPRSEAIMIASRDKLIGVGGVMGGGDTEVDEATRNIVLEVATFDMYSIRRTSMAHGLFTDAVTRFNKGQSPLQNLRVLAKAVHEVRTLAGGKVASEVIDINHVPPEALERDSLYAPVTVSQHFINERLGFDLSAEDMAQLLRNVEFRVEVADEELTVTAPFWRTDIEIPEDVVEEVGRLYGFDHLPLTLPKRTITPPTKDPLLMLKSAIRDTLSKAGANEVLTYSFVHGNLLDKVGQDKAQAFQIANAISPDLQYYRLSLTPSLLEKVHPNVKAGYDEFAIFEMGKKHQTQYVDKEGLPNESDVLAMVLAVDSKKAQQKYRGAAYYQAKEYVERLLRNVPAIKFVGMRDYNKSNLVLPEWMKPFDEQRSSLIILNDGVIGIVGEYRQAVRRALKLPDFSAGFEIGLYFLQKFGRDMSYIQLPRFPKVEQDICLKVPANTQYRQVFDLANATLKHAQPEQVRYTLTPIDIYQRENDTAHKQITLRLSIASYERTLTDEEVNKLLDQVAQAAAEQLQAERI